MTSNQLIPSQVLRTSSQITTSNATLTSHIGDTIHHKHNNHFRLVLQNPNGFSSENDHFSYQLCLHNMQSISADIILLPETNIQWNDYSVAAVTSRHRRDTFSFSKQISSNSTQIYDSTYQPGGTCSILVDKMVGRHHSSFSDPTLGRWTVTNLNMRRDQHLSIICCYQVCNQSISTVGPKTAFAQQWSLLREKGIHHPNPRKQFYSDLDELIASLRRQGNMIILAGDFNSTLGDDPTGLDRILHKYNLADTIQHLHGSYHCATHIRGSKCIDYIFCSSEFLPAVQRGAILPFQSITFSDHRPIFLDLDITTTFQTPLSSLLKPHQ